MSIISLVKVTLYSHQQDKYQVLKELQEMGCLHVIPLKPMAESYEEGPSPQVREALAFLKSCLQQRRQVTNPEYFDGTVVANRTLELRLLIQQLEDERDFLEIRIQDLQLWGDFTFPPLDERYGLRLWFYQVPHYLMNKVENQNLVWEIVGRDNRFAYVVVVSEQEPQDMPMPRTHTGGEPLSHLRRRLEEVEIELEDAEAERSSLTRWCALFARDLARLEDQAALAETFRSTHDIDPLFVLQGWLPEDQVEQLQTYADERVMALQIETPDQEETPPTLLRNRPALAGGQDLVSFYMTPGYWLSDPSVIVFFSFIFFFAMIVGDVGYGLILFLGLALGWRRMGSSMVGRRLRILFAAMIGVTLVWGMLVGSYFGAAPLPETLLSRFKRLDLNNYDMMMSITIVVGTVHLMLANAVDLWRHGLSPGALSPAGWILILIGGLLVWSGTESGYWFMGIGGLGVLLFTSRAVSPVKRMVDGLLALTRIPNAFGDILSYLRLFALGLATTSLALAFNGLAAQVHDAVPGVGLLLGLLVLLIGHGLNLALALMSGFVHGLRLNFIEFFNWSIPEEGVPFRAFEKKEIKSWNP